MNITAYIVLAGADFGYISHAVLPYIQCTVNQSVTLFNIMWLVA